MSGASVQKVTTSDDLADGGKINPRQGIPGGSGLPDGDKLRDKLPKVIVNFKVGGVKMAKEVDVEMSAPGVLVGNLDIGEVVEKMRTFKGEMPKNVFEDVESAAAFAKGRSHADD
jgi:hypothetical protein